MITVANKRTHQATGRDVYIGRPSVLGNPFSHLPNTLAQYAVSTRSEAVSRYRDYLENRLQEQDAVILRALEAIPDDAVLVCWCAPLSCHGHVIAEILNRQRGLN